MLKGDKHLKALFVDIIWIWSHFAVLRKSDLDIQQITSIGQWPCKYKTGKNIGDKHSIELFVKNWN
jgi:hypothetical protein